MNNINIVESEDSIEATNLDALPSSRSSRLLAAVSNSVRSIQSAVSEILVHHPVIYSEKEHDLTRPFSVTPESLSKLADERTREALINTVEQGLSSELASSSTQSNENSIETPSENSRNLAKIKDLVQRMRKGSGDLDADAEVAANLLSSYFLRSSPDRGISPSPVGIEYRNQIFGVNSIADKKLSSFLELMFEAVQDFVLIMLIVLGVLNIVIETTLGRGEGEKCTYKCYIEGVAILTSVCIVVLVTAGIDYAKQAAFVRLSESLDASNTKSIIRGDQQISVTDGELVVGDILSVNSHNLASIPADCLLLGPVSEDNLLQMDESTLTGESKLIKKKPGDIILSGSTAVQGSGKMVVIAVGINSVAGKIKARVYDSDDHDGEELQGDEESPLFLKLTLIAKQIGWIGTFAAVLAFVAMCVRGLVFDKKNPREVIEYFVVAVTVLAVAVPEGLPLAVTLSLAFSSNRMTKDQNLVKHLDACETMGCATTICTDKTGTLTANRMTVRAIYTDKHNYICTESTQKLGELILDLNRPLSQGIIQLISNLISINSMNESVLYFDDTGKTVKKSSGNPTECALLSFVHDLGNDYQQIRDSTPGRSEKLRKDLSLGKKIEFSSARKMMGWAVPTFDPMTNKQTGIRLYMKGAFETILSRSVSCLVEGPTDIELSDVLRQEIVDVAESYSRRGMRCIGLAYRDLPLDADFKEIHESKLNADGTPAASVETDLIFVGLVGIEDPLRPEVPAAIQKCYEAGIDVRMVTGDSPNTAVSIAYQAGILRKSHFLSNDGSMEMIASNLKDNVLMEGKEFRERVHRVGSDGKKEFDQTEFDKIWPHLRVLARSSPDDKLTLAHGLNQSALYTNKDHVKQLLRHHGIKIFPDRQVIAMTGDGTNDAPALKRADIGFAMGIAGTQIAKDAADIILLDDNFASIVTAAKWGRNVYASIQKFLQFQLTVNISAVITALVGAFTYHRSPLAAIQLLWVNLLMDALASLALASEPPDDRLLQKPPVNRSRHMVTKRMWANMWGQAIYQIIVIMTLLFAGPDIFGFNPGHLEEQNGPHELGEDWKKRKSTHYTLIFNTFVWMQLFNEVNCRNLKGEFFVCRGILNNWLFCSILFVTSVLQVIMVQFGSHALSVSADGLSLKYWLISLVFGFGSLPVQQIINLWYMYGQNIVSRRKNKRLEREAQLTTMDPRSAR